MIDDKTLENIKEIILDVRDSTGFVMGGFSYSRDAIIPNCDEEYGIFGEDLKDLGFEISHIVEIALENGVAVHQREIERHRKALWLRTKILEWLEMEEST